MQIDAEGDHLSPELLDLLDSKRDRLKEPKVLTHTPYLLTSLVFVPPYQMRGCFHILCDGLLAQHMLPGFDCLLYHRRLNTDGQGYNHGIDVLAGEEIVEGVTGCIWRVIICLDRLICALGKLFGGCSGTRVYGFEGEDRSCLDGGEMLWTIPSIIAMMMVREGDTNLVAQRFQLRLWLFRLTFLVTGER